MEIILSIGIVFLTVVFMALLVYMRNEKNAALEQAEQRKQDYSKLLSQKKSSEIVLGQVAEKLVPFTDLFEHDPQKASFLGNPIDFVVFNDDEVVFIEVKSGNSKLTAKQRRIKKVIQDKKVRWEEIKIK